MVVPKGRVVGPTQSELNEFHDSLLVAKSSALPGEMPDIETSREIAAYFNRGNLKGLDAAGYFVLNGVKVYEAGRREAADKHDGGQAGIEAYESVPVNTRPSNA